MYVVLTMNLFCLGKTLSQAFKQTTQALCSVRGSVHSSVLGTRKRYGTATPTTALTATLSTTLKTALTITLSATLSTATVGHAAAPSGYVLEGMPLIRQSYNACGPASIAQVMGYFGRQVNFRDVSAWTRPTERSYMSAQAIVKFAPMVGMEARLYANGTLNTVRRAIKRGIPLIALQSHVTKQRKVIPHWRVIVGFDDAERAVYIKDPLLGYIAINYNDFKRVWKEQRGQFAVMYMPEMRSVVRKTLG